MKRLKKLLRLVIVIVVLISGIRAFNIWSNYESTETPQQFVERVHNFYIDSGYNSEDLYVVDKVKLERIKQNAVDELSYVQTVKYIEYQKGKGEKIDAVRLNYIDETLELLKDGIKRVPKPEYLTIDTKNVIETKQLTASELVFQNLLK